MLDTFEVTLGSGLAPTLTYDLFLLLTRTFPRQNMRVSTLEPAKGKPQPAVGMKEKKFAQSVNFFTLAAVHFVVVFCFLLKLTSTSLLYHLELNLNF